MAANTGKLVGRTVFITGASRGIGKAIALKLAKDGANVIIAAKTAEPHPKLPGTIYTAAKEATKGYTCLETMLGDKRLLGDVKRMSTADQTSSLEAFHSLVLSFAPKHTAFSWLGMRTRLKLAALHFNENSGRQQAQTAEGEDRYSVIYSKTKHFECRVRPIPSSHTVVEDAGGKALPCVVDIRIEEQVQGAVKEAVKKFGGIDILVNNASAISLTGTLQTPMKRYDLMNGINARGTYLCSQVCLPHLLKGKNPHILNLSPPLNMAARWFKGHVAYTMAKYGMSMCALGMAEEFRDEGVAVNTLWPRTAIYTAAMEMLGGGPEVAKQCRSVDIMADAAYVILTQDSRSFTGNFCIDDEVLLQNGVKDVSVYDCVPGSKLLPDFFLDISPEQLAEQMSVEGATPAFYKSAPSGGTAAAESSSSSSSASSGGPAQTFQLLKGMLSEELVQRVKGVFQFELTGSDAGTWFLDLKNGTGAVGNGEPEGGADCTMILDSVLFTDMFAGKASPTTSFMMGKLKIKGDMTLAMKLEKLMQQTQKSKL